MGLRIILPGETEQSRFGSEGTGTVEGYPREDCRPAQYSEEIVLLLCYTDTK